ncbi:hypothetical protein D3C85_1699080 [compost metagenome]
MRNIQRLLRASLLFRYKARGQGDYHDNDRHVDQKHRTPVEMLQQQTTDQRAKRRPA